MLLDGETDPRLRARDTLQVGKLLRARIIEVALDLQAKTLQHALADTRSHHGDVGDDGVELPVEHRLIDAGYRTGIGVEDLLHLEVRRGVDRVDECPLVVEGDVGVRQLAIDRAEALDHDRLTDLRILVERAFVIVATRGDEVPFEVVALRIADDHDGEHVELLGIELCERGELDDLLLTARLTDVADGRVGAAVLSEDLQQAVDLPVAALALGVVDGGDEVACCGSLDALLDTKPRRHQVGERDDTQVMADGAAEQSGGLLEGADAREYLYLDLIRDALLAHHLIDQGRHAVDASVARGDDADGLALEGVAEGLFGALTLSLHPAVDTQGIGADIVLDKAEVILVSDDHIRGLHGLEYGGGDILGATRADASDDDLILFHLK